MPTALNPPMSPASSSSNGVTSQNHPTTPSANTPNTRAPVTQTPQPRISRYGNPSYVASPDMSGRTPSATRTSGAAFTGNKTVMRSLLSRPATPPGSPLSPQPQQPSQQIGLSSLSRSGTNEFAGDVQEESAQEDLTQPPKEKLGAIDYLVHIGDCVIKTLMMIAYAFALFDIKCLATGRRLFDSISNNYRVDRLLFVLTCAAILVSIAVVLSTTQQPAIFSHEQLDSQIKQEIDNKMTVLKNLLKTELAKEKGVSHKELESAFRQFSSHIDEVITTKYELQEEKITQKAAEVAGAYLRSLEEKTNTMERINQDVSAKYSEFNQAMSFLQTFQREVQELQDLMKSPLVTVEQFQTTLREQKHELIEREREEISTLRNFVKQNFVTNSKLTTEFDLFKSQQDSSLNKLLETKLSQISSGKNIKEDTVRGWVLEELSRSGVNKDTKDLIRSVIQEEVRQSLHKVEPNVQSIEQITREIIERTAVDVVDRYAATLRNTEGSVPEDTIQQWIEDAVKRHSPSQGSKSTSSGNWDEGKIVQIVEDALERFAADKIGKPDFALRTAGASIVESRTSESFGQNFWSSLPVPFTRRVVTQNPSVILEPDVTIGRCWAFAGGKGHITIALSEPVSPTAFTLDHISPSIAHVRGLASAPRDFVVYGLQNATDSGVRIGTYTYDTSRNRASQTFAVQAQTLPKFPLITLEVLSNYGHHYTCLYRFRVHSDV